MYERIIPVTGGGSLAALRVGPQIAISRHEKFDGMGYPRGLSGADIPLYGRNMNNKG